MLVNKYDHVVGKDLDPTAGQLSLIVAYLRTTALIHMKHHNLDLFAVYVLGMYAGVKFDNSFLDEEYPRSPPKWPKLAFGHLEVGIQWGYSQTDMLQST